MEHERYLSALDRIYDMPSHLLGAAEVFVPTPEQRLERIEVTREFLDRAVPGWRDVRVVHVAGTSGKGSTAWMLAAMLSRRHRTGLITSPHLFDLRERIRVDLEPISREDLVRIYEGRVEASCARLVEEDRRFALRFPEVILACAFVRFLEVDATWAVVETALGGRYDQTNVMEPQAAAITNVSFDHMHQLGDDLRGIAHHKAGIIKPGVPVYTTAMDETVLEVIRDEAERVEAPLHIVEWAKGAGGTLRFRGADWHLAMRGEHQRQNAALALTIALDVAGLPATDCRAALSTAQMPARFQEVRPGLFADVAHNPAKTQALASTISEALAGRRAVLVLGLTDNKEASGVLAPLVDVADAMVFTRSRYRGADPSTLLAAWEDLDEGAGPGMVVDSPREALELALEQAGEGGVVVVTGSTFVVDEALNPEAELLEANALYVPPGEATEGRRGCGDG
jgi:dihydrofolate synthase/folylpolyglutamate synthase